MNFNDQISVSLNLRYLSFNSIYVFCLFLHETLYMILPIYLAKTLNCGSKFTNCWDYVPCLLCVRRIIWSTEHPGPIQSGSNTNLLDLRSSKAVYYYYNICSITNYSIVCSGVMGVCLLFPVEVSGTKYKLQD